ncbi:MAG: SAF domain-containing protein, partial [Chloroflexota bacterium]
MQRGRLFILIGLLLLLATVALFLILNGLPGGGGETTPAAPVVGEGTPVETPVLDQIVIAIQPIPRGEAIRADAVGFLAWPASDLPTNAITDQAQVIGKMARYDIGQGEPILSSLVSISPEEFSATGSEAALLIPREKVAMTIPMNRLSAVGYALREGDHVNVLVSLLFVDLEEVTQTITPSIASVFTNVTVDPLTGSTSYSLQGIGVEGQVKFSEGEGGISIPFLIQPSENQRPRLVVQQIVQDAVVLHVGDFMEEEAPIAGPTATPVPDATALPPTPIPPPDIITLIVSPQDALVLNYFLYSKARFTLVLRAANDPDRVVTDSVTLQYVIENPNFRIPAPTQLQYGLQPAVRDTRPPKLFNEPSPKVIPLPDGTY